MIEVFISGCTTCGTNSVYIARIRSVHPDVVIYNTRYEGAAQRTKHLDYMKMLGLKTDDYVSLVVENNGERIMRLEKWKPSL